MRASGMLQMKGNIRKPRMAKRGPPAFTAGSSPYGPPATSKYIRKMSGMRVSFLLVVVVVVMGSSWDMFWVVTGVVAVFCGGGNGGGRGGPLSPPTPSAVMKGGFLGL